MSHVNRVVLAVRDILGGGAAICAELANGYAENPANCFEQTPNGKRDGHSDQQNHERNRQRDARCPSE